MKWTDNLESKICELKTAGTYKYPKHITTPVSSHVHMKELSGDITVLSSNNYLGLSNNKEVVQASKSALDKYGLGTSSVRFICGTMDIHQKLEEQIAAMHSMEASLTYSSCWSANTGLFAVLCGKGDVLISDALNHASIIDGCRLVSKDVLREVYRHSDMKHLEDILKTHRNALNRYVVTDGVFSMEGDIAKLPDLVALCKKYDAVLIVDDSHGVGVMGNTGKGTAEHFDLESEVDIVTGTLGKALGGAAGGYVAGPQALIDMLFQSSRPQIFSNAISPSTAAGALKAIELMDEKRLGSLHDKVEYFKNGLDGIGLKTLKSDSAILAVVLGETAKAIQFSEKMFGKGFFVTGFGFPVVPEGEARIRIQVSDAMTLTDIDRALAALEDVAAEF